MKSIFKKTDLIIVVIFIIIGVLFRLIPHAPNFVPISALAIFAGAYLSKRIALFVPFLMMIVSDFFLGFYNLKLMAVVYASFLICVVVGFWLKNNKKWYTILGSSFLTAFIFFFLTNLAVFVFSGWYPKTILGLADCFIMALPFFKNTLLGDIFYASVFFASFELLKIWVAKKNINFNIEKKYNTYEKRSIKAI